MLSGYLLSEEGSQLGSKMCPPGLNFIFRQQLSSTSFHLSGKCPHLCTEASGMVTGLVSSCTPDVTLPVWLEGDLALVSACQRSDDGETWERRKVSFLCCPWVRFWKGVITPTCKREVGFLGFSPLSLSLGKDAMEVKDIFMDKISGVIVNSTYC